MTQAAGTPTTDDDSDTDAPAGTGTSAPALEKAFTQADLDRIVAERVTRERAKYADYGDLKKRAAAAMTEQERAVSEAEARGKTSALQQSGARLARAEFKAAAAGRVPPEALSGFLEYADLSKFVDPETGEPNEKAIAAAVKKLGGDPKSTNFDGGARGSAQRATDMNSRIRKMAGFD